MEESWIVFAPFAFPALIVAFALGFSALARYFKHKERMAMIERGIYPGSEEEPEPASKSSESTLTAGLIVGMIGLAITLGLLTLGIGPWLIGGLVPTAIGAGLVIGHYLQNRQEKGRGPGEGGDGREG